MAKKKATRSEINFPIVGIGDSVGAIEAVIEIVEHFSSNTGMAYIYLQHPSPDVESKIAEGAKQKIQIACFGS